MVNTGLTDKVVLVTGANHGIGAATAKAFAAEGAKVFIQYLRLSVETSQETTGGANVPGEAFYLSKQAMSANEVVQAIRKHGGQVEVWEADLSDPANILILYNRVEAAFGPVDVLVNNAAHCQQDSFMPQSKIGLEDRAPDGFPMQTITALLHDQHFAVNSRAVALMMAEYIRRYLERGAQWGRIINMSTDGAYRFPGEISYGASKNAMESYSRSAAVEVGKYGITVNIVSPGPIQTGWISAELAERIISENPLKRIGQPQDVADVIIFLASEQARWLTGQTLHVGGGHTM